MQNRVVITGLGVVSAIGNNVKTFTQSLRKGKSGVIHQPMLADWGLGCQLGAIPEISSEEEKAFTQQYNIVKLRSPGVLYGCMAGVEAWRDAGLPITTRKDTYPDWDSGCIFGTSCGGVDAYAYNVLLALEGQSKKMGGRIAQQAMNSGISAYLGGIIGFGNQVTTNASEGNTGLESIIEAYNRIKYGQAQRMLAGSMESSSPYIFEAYDSSLAFDDKYCLIQEKGKHKSIRGSRFAPFSSKADGFVVGAGSGALVLESLKSALKRNAHIYAEVMGGSVGSGGQREDGSAKKPSSTAFISQFRDIIKKTKTDYDEITYVSGNFQSYYDYIEIEDMVRATNWNRETFPYLNSTKSLVGNCLSASGSIETVAMVTQMENSFVHPNINSRPLDPRISACVDDECIPDKTIENVNFNKVIKISLGIGDLNSCLILQKWRG